MSKKAGFLRELEKLDDDGVLIILAMPSIYQDINLKILDFLVNKKKHKCVYLSLNKPHNKIVSLLKKKKIDPDNFFFIDSVYKSVYCTEPNIRNVLFVSSPHGLTEMSISLNKALSSFEGEKKFIFLDSLSTLLVYNDALPVTKFAHFLVGRTIAAGMKGVLMSLQRDSESAVIDQIEPFVDGVVIARS